MVNVQLPKSSVSKRSLFLPPNVYFNTLRSRHISVNLEISMGSSSGTPVSRAKLRPRRGRLWHLEQFLGLRQAGPFPTDAVFVSLDLEVASDRGRIGQSGEKPATRQFGFAYLDTEDAQILSPSATRAS